MGLKVIPVLSDRDRDLNLKSVSVNVNGVQALSDRDLELKIILKSNLRFSGSSVESECKERWFWRILSHITPSCIAPPVKS